MNDIILFSIFDLVFVGGLISVLSELSVLKNLSQFIKSFGIGGAVYNGESESSSRIGL